MISYEQDERARHHFDLKAALYAGLAVGCIFLFVAKGNPWSSPGIPTHAMGRRLFSVESSSNYFFIGVIQMVLSLCYAFIVSAIVYRMRAMTAIWSGAGIGLALYGLNYLVFRFLITNAPPASEVTVALTHVAFCMITAGAFKGLSVPKPREDTRPLR
jgi:hypothetical protein